MEKDDHQTSTPPLRMVTYCSPAWKGEKTEVIILMAHLSKNMKEKADEIQGKIDIGLRFMAPEKNTGFLAIFNFCILSPQFKEKVFFFVWDLTWLQPKAFNAEMKLHLKEPGKVSLRIPFEGKHWPGFTPFLIGGSRVSLLRSGGLSPWLRHPRNVLLDFAERLQSMGVSRTPYPQVFPRGKAFELPKIKRELELLRSDGFMFADVSKTQNHLILKKPDFILVGAQKAGTTSLINWINLHPDIHTPKLKGNSFETFELHFFGTDKFQNLGTKWYTSLFHHPTKKISGEKTPEYLSNEKSIERMHSLCPEAKIIVSLRNPVERLWSALRHMRREGVMFGNHAFREGSLREAHDRIVKDFMADEIVFRGHYYDQLEHLFKFYPREKVLILIHEKTLQDPVKSRKALFSFLDLPDLQDVPFPKKNKGQFGEEERSPESLKSLYAHYRPRNEKLFDLLNDRIEEWEEPRK